MAIVSSRYTELAALPKRELAAIFSASTAASASTGAAGSAPDVASLIGYEFRGYNQPRSTALLGIRKFIKAFYTNSDGRPFGCNTPVVQNGLDNEWLAKPTAERPKRYAFFLVEPADPQATDAERRAAVLFDYGRGGNRGYDVARIIRDYVVRVEPGSDDLLLGKAYFVVGGTRLAHSFFLIERYRELPGGRVGLVDHEPGSLRADGRGRADEPDNDAAPGRLPGDRPDGRRRRDRPA